jgi:hypothetical protein
VLADRSLSQLLKDDWPRTLEDWEAMRKPRAQTSTPSSAASSVSTRHVDSATRRHKR